MARPRSYKGGTYSPINPEMTTAEKNRARRITSRAIKSGRLTRPIACQDCGRTDLPVQVHHPDYRKPLDVMWLCRWCHWKEHGRIADAACFGYWRKDRVRESQLRAKREAERHEAQERRRRLYERRRTARLERLAQHEKRKAVIAEMVAAGARPIEIADRIGLSLSGASHYMRRHELRASQVGAE